MAKIKSRYVCSQCGYSTGKWLGNCPSCGAWNTFEEERDLKSVSTHRASRVLNIEKKEVFKLSEVTFEHTERRITGIQELDRVLGGGFTSGSFTLLGGDPGIGKSTLALQIAKIRPEWKILYCSGEESVSQLQQRAKRLQADTSQILATNETDVTILAEIAAKEQPDLLIIDSIQTVYRSDMENLPGSVTQIRESAAVLMQLAKQKGITTLIIGHVTKDGDLAGPRILEHMVDTVLQFEGDNSLTHRLIRTLKNRFGPAGEIGVFEMNGEGLKEVSNPSELFLSGYNEAISGNAITASLEGTRPILVEIQALISPTSYSVPQRTASGFDVRRLGLLLAVLEKRCHMKFSNQDVFLNIAGGLKITEPSIDLSVVAALVSGLLDKPLPKKSVYIGEVGLAGEVRSVNRLDVRIQEAQKMGYQLVYVPHSSVRVSGDPKTIIKVRNLSELFRHVF